MRLVKRAVPSVSNALKRVRYLSDTSSSYSSLEYPLRSQAPTVTRTSAAEARNEPPQKYPRKFPSDDVEHYFDESDDISPEEEAKLLEAQKQKLVTKLESSTAITPQIPVFIPPTVSADQLEKPETIITKLENGIRVVSQETYAQVCTVGVLFDAGSRHETTVGTAHLLEMLAFHSTKSSFHSALDISRALQNWGGNSFCNTSREQTLHCIDILRPNAHHAMQLLKEVVLEPQFSDEEVEDCQRAMEFQAKDFPHELSLGEALQIAAFGTDQQLGKLHFCPPDEVVNLNANLVRDFWQTNMVGNPQGMVVAGTGIDHNELVDMTRLHFGHLEQTTPVEGRTIPSVYRGGQHAIRQPTPSEFAAPSPHNDGLTRVAVAFELGGWHSADLVSTCVLQTLLGGGNAFSAGGPGKGMYSRLYRQVLNRYVWAESAEAFTAFSSETGLFGMSGGSQPYKSRDVAMVLIEHMNQLASELVTDEEIDRARNMLKCNVLSQLESRLILFEDIGRQILTYGHREDTATMCAKVDAVTKEDLQLIARKALQKPPTIAAVGRDLSRVPSQSEVATWI